MSIGLDNLIFGGSINNNDQAEERLETIEAYLQGCGYTWDDVIENICHPPESN